MLPDAALPLDRPPCICKTLRAATRVVSHHYDVALAPVDLTITGYSLLASLDALGSAGVTELADAVVMDRSTLTRNLDPLLAAGLVKARSGRDRRRKELSLTAQGRRTLARAYPLWLDAQRRFTAAYGDSESRLLTAMLTRATTLPHD